MMNAYGRDWADHHEKFTSDITQALTRCVRRLRSAVSAVWRVGTRGDRGQLAQQVLHFNSPARCRHTTASIDTASRRRRNTSP